MPPIVLTIISIVNLALTYAPQAEKVYDEAKQLIAMLFSGGIITADQQATLMGWADAHQAATLAGTKPPELLIDPDPTAPPPTPV
jgi:hypothetical protein